MNAIAVIGATGQQGGHVVDTLLEEGATVRAIVRDPDSERARALAARGVELARGDQEDPDSLRTALAGVDAMFLMTTYDGDDGVDGEVRRGIAVAEAAADAGVPRVVYSSVGGAERDTGVPHFESKRRIELRLEELLPVRFVRPTFFMDNLRGQLADVAQQDEVVVRFPLAATTPVQMGSSRDVGAAAARLLLDPDAIAGQAIEIAGDELTGEDIAARVAERFGRPARYEEAPLSVLGDDADRRAMFRWFAETPAYQADLGATRRLLPDVLDLRGWLARQD